MEQNNNKETVVLVNVEFLIAALNNIYSRGVDYVDLSINKRGTEDSITLSFSKEYINEEYRNNFEDDFFDSENNSPISKDEEPTKLTTEYIKNLL